MLTSVSQSIKQCIRHLVNVILNLFVSPTDRELCARQLASHCVSHYSGLLDTMSVRQHVSQSVCLSALCELISQPVTVSCRSECYGCHRYDIFLQTSIQWSLSQHYSEDIILDYFLREGSSEGEVYHLYGDE